MDLVGRSTAQAGDKMIGRRRRNLGFFEPRSAIFYLVSVAFTVLYLSPRASCFPLPLLWSLSLRRDAGGMALMGLY